MADGYFLTDELIRWFLAKYVPRPELVEIPWWLSPLDQNRALAGLPPAMVVTAGFDPLRDEGEAYADKLQRHGVPVTRRRCDSLIHGFFTMGGAIDAASEAIEGIFEEFRGAMLTARATAPTSEAPATAQQSV